MARAFFLAELSWACQKEGREPSRDLDNMITCCGELHLEHSILDIPAILSFTGSLRAGRRVRTEPASSLLWNDGDQSFSRLTRTLRPSSPPAHVGHRRQAFSVPIPFLLWTTLSDRDPGCRHPATLHCQVAVADSKVTMRPTAAEEPTGRRIHTQKHQNLIQNERIPPSLISVFLTLPSHGAIKDARLPIQVSNDCCVLVSWQSVPLSTDGHACMVGSQYGERCANLIWPAPMSNTARTLTRKGWPST